MATVIVIEAVVLVELVVPVVVVNLKVVERVVVVLLAVLVSVLVVVGVMVKVSVMVLVRVWVLVVVLAVLVVVNVDVTSADNDAVTVIVEVDFRNAACVDVLAEADGVSVNVATKVDVPVDEDTSVLLFVSLNALVAVLV